MSKKTKRQSKPSKSADAKGGSAAPTLLADLLEQKKAALTIWLKGEGDLRRFKQRQRGMWQRYMNITKKIQRLQWAKVG